MHVKNRHEEACHQELINKNKIIILQFAISLLSLWEVFLWRKSNFFWSSNSPTHKYSTENKIICEIINSMKLEIFVWKMRNISIVLCTAYYKNCPRKHDKFYNINYVINVIKSILIKQIVINKYNKCARSLTHICSSDDARWSDYLCHCEIIYQILGLRKIILIIKKIENLWT